MNWARQNPFVAGLVAAVLLGVAVFGWLIATALSRNAEIDEQYRTQVNELQRLERLQPYPEESSRGLLEEKKKEYAAAVTTLQAQLANEASPPLETAISPTEFQGRLREAVERSVRDARAGNIALPADFYLGFEPYRTGLPTPGLAPLLAFQLKRCEEIVRVLIASRIDAVTAFKRAPLPDEVPGGVPAPAPTPTAAGGTAKAGSPAPAAPLVVTYPVELEFRASPNAFRVAMDELVKSPSFHLVRALRVKNEKEKGPSRDESPAELAAAAAAAPSTPTPAPPAAPSPPTPATPPIRGGRGAATGPAGVNVPEPALPERQTLRYVVGMEKISAALRVESVRFTAPSPPASSSP